MPGPLMAGSYSITSHHFHELLGGLLNSWKVFFYFLRILWFFNLCGRLSSWTNFSKDSWIFRKLCDLHWRCVHFLEVPWHFQMFSLLLGFTGTLNSFGNSLYILRTSEVLTISWKFNGIYRFSLQFSWKFLTLWRSFMYFLVVLCTIQRFFKSLRNRFLDLFNIFFLTFRFLIISLNVLKFQTYHCIFRLFLELLRNSLNLRVVPLARKLPKLFGSSRNFQEVQWMIA